MIGAWLIAAAAVASVTPAPARIVAGPALPLHVGGRTVAGVDGLRRQWPGTYVEGAFSGREALLRVGPGEMILHVLVDGRPAATLVKPAPGLYRVAGLAPGRHLLRVEVASESQAGATVIGGLYAASGSVPLPAPPARPRSIEFIGDSHTVGYGNTAAQRACSEDQVWATTDTSQGIAAVTARHYGADYRVHAISGRGIVRNYDGFAADTVPVAYPFALFDRTHAADDTGWEPQLIVIALGTNDFSTPLKAGEPWRDRAALHADYEAHYLRFLRALRAAHPHAHLLLWATDLAEGEIAAEERRVVAQAGAAGLDGIGFVQVPKLALTGCHFHPSVADDRLIADTIARYVDAHPGIWRSR